MSGKPPNPQAADPVAARWAALLDSSELQQVVWETVADAMVLSDADGIVLAANPAYARLYGYSLDEILGHDFAIIFPTERRTWAREQYQLTFAATEPPPVYESIVRRADGVERVVESRIAFVVRDGRRVALLSTIRDITERKAAEATLRLSEQRQSTLAEMSLLLASSLDYPTLLQRLARFLVPRLGDWCIIYLRDEDGAIHRAATAHVDPARELIMRDLVALPLDVHQTVGVERVMETAQGLVIPDLDDWLSDGSYHTPQMTLIRQLGIGSGIAVPLIARGNILGVISLVTQPGRSPHDDGDLNLATELAEHAALFIDNAYLYRQAQAAIVARDEFLSIVSHELKTPLTSLTLLAQFFQQLSEDEAFAARSRARLPQMAASNARQVKRLTGLINDLLDVSRISAGRLDLNLEDVDLAAVARAVVEACADDAAAAGSLLTLHADGPVVGHWDQVRLGQVVTNLVGNAIKYGEGRPIEVTVDGDETTARLTVRDHGVGITADDLVRIFDPFERTVAARTRQGMGLGLYITRQIVTAHGGRVWADSQPGEGSTFGVELPRSTVPPRSPANRQKGIE